jgi:hypothetical protein
MPAISDLHHRHIHSWIAATPTVVGGKAVLLKMIVGFTATLPSLAPHENIDIRATH